MNFIEANRRELIQEYKVRGFLKEQINRRMIQQFYHPQEGPSFDLHKLQKLFYQLREVYPLRKGEEDSWL